MSKNKVTRVEIFRRKTESRYTILISRKNSVKVYLNISKSRALSVNLACAGRYQNTENHNAYGGVWAIFKPYPRKTQPIRVYFVQIGQDGYMPDSVSAYPTLEQAISAAQSEKRFDLDGFYPNCKATGNIRKFGEYKVLIDGRYHHTIRISVDTDPSIHALETPYFPIDSRSKLESFCEWYNEQCY